MLFGIFSEVLSEVRICISLFVSATVHTQKLLQKSTNRLDLKLDLLFRFIDQYFQGERSQS